MSELPAHSTSRPIGKLPTFWGAAIVSEVIRSADARLQSTGVRAVAAVARSRLTRGTFPALVTSRSRTRFARRFATSWRQTFLSSSNPSAEIPAVTTDDYVDRESRDLCASQVRSTANAAGLHGPRHRQGRLHGVLHLSGHDQPGGVDDLRPVGDAGGPRRPRPVGRVPPASGRHRPVGDASGHQLRRSRAHRWSRSWCRRCELHCVLPASMD